MTESENLKAYFTANRRKLVSVKAVEVMAGLPQNTLRNFLNDQRGIPEHHLENIVNVLELVGYQPTPEFKGNFL